MQTTNHEMQNGKSATTNKNTEVRNLKHETGMLDDTISETGNPKQEKQYTRNLQNRTQASNIPQTRNPRLGRRNTRAVPRNLK